MNKASVLLYGDANTLNCFKARVKCWKHAPISKIAEWGTTWTKLDLWWLYRIRGNVSVECFIAGSYCWISCTARNENPPHLSLGCCVRKILLGRTHVTFTDTVPYNTTFAWPNHVGPLTRHPKFWSCTVS